MKESLDKFVQANSPDGGFLQSEEWRKFQERYGRKTFNIAGEHFWANIIEHQLKLVGNYFYVPRGPLISRNSQLITHNSISELIDLAKKERAGWIRIEPANEKALVAVEQSIKYKITKAPHDMQPKEIFVIDISKPEEQLLSEMKSKTRYNIKLAEKKGVSVHVIPAKAGIQEIKSVDSGSEAGMTSEYFDEFLRLVKITAQRNKISAHPEEYYRQMWETIPAENLKLYIAEYQNKIIAANLVLFYGEMATYLHGASDNEFREVMAPYLLQWTAIQDAKKAGCTKYDFGGISTRLASTASSESRRAKYESYEITNKLQGVTKFKLGFSPEIKPTEFPGAFDMVVDSRKYFFYRLISQIKSFVL